MCVCVCVRETEIPGGRAFVSECVRVRVCVMVEKYAGYKLCFLMRLAKRGTVNKLQQLKNHIQLSSQENLAKHISEDTVYWQQEVHLSVQTLCSPLEGDTSMVCG